PGRDRMAFMRLGLRPGDQVTAINGTPLDDRDRGEQILHTLSSSSEAHVTVIRNGQPQDLVLNIAQVAQEADSLAAQEQPGGAAAMSPSGNAGAPFAPPPGTPAGERIGPSPAIPEQAGDGRGQ
ncbi:MAG TPA: PDZ domain-containing protein, partial [Steroidobacteraceae bacterium]|nr:PDZ domain-containing protein [Steroidobacteraceae bacterium]